MAALPDFLRFGRLPGRPPFQKAGGTQIFLSSASFNKRVLTGLAVASLDQIDDLIDIGLVNVAGSGQDVATGRQLVVDIEVQPFNRAEALIVGLLVNGLNGHAALDVVKDFVAGVVCGVEYITGLLASIFCPQVVSSCRGRSKRI